MVEGWSGNGGGGVETRKWRGGETGVEGGVESGAGMDSVERGGGGEGGVVGTGQRWEGMRGRRTEPNRMTPR